MARTAELVKTRNYDRSIEDPEEFVDEPDVTCLVGKNESGKTTIEYPRSADSPANTKLSRKPVCCGSGKTLKSATTRKYPSCSIRRLSQGRSAGG